MSVCSSHGPAALAVGDQPLQMSSTDAPCPLSFSSVSLSLLTSLSSHGQKAAGTSAPRASSCAPAHLSHAAAGDRSPGNSNPWMSTPAAFRPCRLKPDHAGKLCRCCCFCWSTGAPDISGWASPRSDPIALAPSSPVALLPLPFPASPWPPAACFPASSESIRSVRIRSTMLVRLLHGFVLLPSGISVAGTGNAMI